MLSLEVQNYIVGRYNWTIYVKIVKQMVLYEPKQESNIFITHRLLFPELTEGDDKAAKSFCLLNLEMLH